MAAVWAIISNIDIPLHENLPTADDMPWTISFVLRKRMQLDTYQQLPKEKQPPDEMIWWGTSEDIDEWFDKVYKRKGEKDDIVMEFDPSEME